MSRVARVAGLALLVAQPVFGQGMSTQQIPVAVAPAATLRALDKVSGDVTDLAMVVGDVAEVGRLSVRLGACRYPPENIQGEAYAWLDIFENEASVFSGWMIASSPALNALDHARYDVWVLRCNNS